MQSGIVSFPRKKGKNDPERSFGENEEAAVLTAFGNS